VGHSGHDKGRGRGRKIGRKVPERLRPQYQSINGQAWKLQDVDRVGLVPVGICELLPETSKLLPETSKLLPETSKLLKSILLAFELLDFKLLFSKSLTSKLLNELLPETLKSLPGTCKLRIDFQITDFQIINFQITARRSPFQIRQPSAWRARQ